MRFFFLILLTSAAFAASDPEPRLHHGILDLREFDLREVQHFHLTGESEFYFGVHLNNDTLNSIVPGPDDYIDFPSNWQNAERHGAVYPAFGIATYRIRVLLPQEALSDSVQGMHFALNLDGVFSAYSIWVNGERIGETGKAGTDAGDFEPLIRRDILHLHSGTDTMTIVFHVSNFFDPTNAGIRNPVTFGLVDDVERQSRIDDAIAFFAFGLFLILFSYHVVSFFVRREERSLLLLGAISFIYAVKVLVDQPYPVYLLFPDLTSAMHVRLQYVGILVIPLLMLQVRMGFPKEMPPFIAYATYLVFGLYGAVMFVLPMPLLFSVNTIILYLAAPVVVAMLGGVMAAAYRGRPFALLYLASSALLGVFGMGEILFSVNVIASPQLSNYGMVVFVTLQSLIVSLKFARSYDDVRSLSSALNKMTEGLEQTVKERTEELRLSEERFRSFFELGVVGMAFLSPDKRWIRVNDHFCRMTGYTHEELSRKTWDELTHPDDAPDDMSLYGRVLSGEIDSYTREKRMVRKDGSVMHVQISVRCERKRDGTPLFFDSLFEDITEQKMANIERDRLLDDLQEAMGNIKTLGGLIPICGSCKKIRDDKGYWSQVELYIMEHTEATFSHGICPDCMKRDFPDVYRRKYGDTKP